MTTGILFAVSKLFSRHATLAYTGFEYFLVMELCAFMLAKSMLAVVSMVCFIRLHRLMST